ncbi:MAG: hypothetical protein ACAH95_10755 [Fimbriimonas sp.]
MMRLFRGLHIAVAEYDATCAVLRTAGQPLNGPWGQSQFVRLPQERDKLLADPQLARARITDSSDMAGICACGDEAGSALYAWPDKPKLSHLPVVAEIQVDPHRVIVDGRDFLYTAFGQWDQENNRNSDKLTAFLERIYGRAVLKYWQKAADSSSLDYRYALSDLAVTDPEVVASHYANNLPFRGRYATRFCSAFIIEGPILPSEVLDVRLAEPSRRHDKWSTFDAMKLINRREEADPLP